jgi:ABC-type amino acid transport substrate-binding protein/tRNA A-37 threonylcarbamoyl transferase component Bud32
MERACDEFENAWRAGHRPSIEDVLGRATEADRPALLRELLPLELHYRRAAGETPTPDEYRRRFPDQAELVAAVFAASQAEASTQHPCAQGAPGERPRPEVSGYEILDELGRGGMGVVYKARQVRLNRTVALKMILAGTHADAAQLARFVAEAQATARMHHPHIVQIHEVGEADNLPYFVLEFMEGGSLSRKLDGAPQPPRDAARLVELLARAVAYAHERGIVHRDLKPANILLAGDRRQGTGDSQDKDRQTNPSSLSTVTPKIADFGLAKVSDVGSLTATGAVMGSPSYMAPEQARGDAKNVGPAADVYALGVILFELLTGRVPFTAESTVALLRKVEGEEAPSPRALCPGVPKELEAVCLRCLEKDPARRYPSATALAEDLDSFLAGKPPAHAPPLGVWGHFRHWRRRNPMRARASALAGLVALLALVVLGVTLPEKDDSLSRVQRRGKLVVAIDPNCPPYAFKEDGRLTGLDVELARALAARLGVEAEHRELYWDWDGLRRGLEDRELDVLISATTITEERQRQVAFIEYARDPLVFTGRPGTPLANKHDLAGKVVAVQEGTTGQATAERLQREGVGFKEIRRYRSTPQSFAAVRSGEADIALDHLLIARYESRDGKLAVAGAAGCDLEPEPLAIALRPEAQALRKALEDALRAVKEDGEFARIQDRWSGR